MDTYRYSTLREEITGTAQDQATCKEQGEPQSPEPTPTIYPAGTIVPPVSAVFGDRCCWRFCSWPARYGYPWRPLAWRLTCQDRMVQSQSSCGFYVPRGWISVRCFCSRSFPPSDRGHGSGGFFFFWNPRMRAGMLGPGSGRWTGAALVVAGGECFSSAEGSSYRDHCVLIIVTYVHVVARGGRLAIVLSWYT